MVHRTLVRGFSLFLISVASGPASSQEYNCTSRLVENHVDKRLKEKFGPTPKQQIQSMLAGIEIKMRFERVNVQTIAASGPVIECSARIRVWRQDTDETTEHTINYSILSQGGQTYVRVQ